MPIEIRELNIKATVSEDSKKQSLQEVDLAKLKKTITAECIENVLQILEDKKQR